MNRALLISLVFLSGSCLAANTISKEGKDPFRDKLSSLFELLGYSASCASATISACRTDCPHNFNFAIWKAKESVNSAAVELSNAILQLENAASCLPSDPMEKQPLESLNLIKPEKLVSSSTTPKPILKDFFPRDCVEVLNKGFNRSAVYEIYPYPNFPYESELVFCDQETDGGGWIVFQRRENQHPRENFNREWADYVYGFGSLSGEFWLGLDLLHLLTKSRSTEMRIDMEDAEGKTRYAKYNNFNIGNLTSKYTLKISRYSGSAGDSLKFHNGQKFTTLDQDNDDYRLNCAHQNNGGWWFNSCLHSNLNGYHYIGKAKHAKGIVWFNWHGYSYSLTRTSMKIRALAHVKEKEENKDM